MTAETQTAQAAVERAKDALVGMLALLTGPPVEVQNRLASSLHDVDALTDRLYNAARLSDEARTERFQSSRV